MIHRRRCKVQKTIQESCNTGTDEERKIIQGVGTFENWKTVCDACTQEDLG